MEQPAPRQAHQQQLSSSNGSSQLTWQKKGWLLQKQHHHMTCVIVAALMQHWADSFAALCPTIPPTILCILFVRAFWHHRSVNQIQVTIQDNKFIHCSECSQ